MSNKSLLIKAPASIDANLPIWNALKITWKVFKSYIGGASVPQYQSGPFNANDKFEITEQEAGTNVAISKKNNFGGITISPDTGDITQFTATVTGDDVYDITHLGGSPAGYRITKVDSMFGEGLDTIANLTNLSYLDLSGTNVTGDVAQLKTLTNLNNLNLGGTNVSGDVAKLSTLTNLSCLDLSGTNVSGDVAKLSTLTNLSYLELISTNVSGDVAKLSTLTNLKDLNLIHTNVSGDVAQLKTLTNLNGLRLNNTNLTGDVAQLKTLTKLITLWLCDTNVSGDLSVLSPTILKISGGSSKGQQKFSWPSPTARSSKTNIPLNLTDGGDHGGWDFGNDLDNFLKDQAACTNYSGNPQGKGITASGNRTSASDSAIETLQKNGWTIKIS